MENEKQESFTTIQLSNGNRDKIEKMKVHPREPYDDVIKRLLDFWQRYKDVVDQKK